MVVVIRLGVKVIFFKFWVKCFRGVGVSGKVSDFYFVFVFFMEYFICFFVLFKLTLEDVRLIWS